MIGQCSSVTCVVQSSRLKPSLSQASPTAPDLPEAMMASQTRLVSSASRKVGAAGLLGLQPIEEVGDLVGEALLVADDEAGHPPLAQVGVVAVGDEDVGPAAQRRLRREWSNN